MPQHNTIYHFIINHTLLYSGIWYGIELLGLDRHGDCDGIFNNERVKGWELLP